MRKVKTNKNNVYSSILLFSILLSEEELIERILEEFEET